MPLDMVSNASPGLLLPKHILTMVNNVNAVEPIGVIKTHIKSAQDLKNVEALSKYHFIKPSTVMGLYLTLYYVHPKNRQVRSLCPSPSWPEIS